MRFAKNRNVFEQGEDAHSFFVLLHGHVRASKTTPAGEQVVVRYVSPGEVFGVAPAIGLDRYPATATAVDDSVALAWPSAAWPRLVSRFPALATNTLQTVGLQETHRSKAKGSGTAATDGVPRHAGAQAPQKEFAIDAMFATGIVHRMEAGNRTTDAAHLEFQKHPDRLRRATHDIVDQVRKSNGHGTSLNRGAG